MITIFLKYFSYEGSWREMMKKSEVWRGPLVQYKEEGSNFFFVFESRELAMGMSRRKNGVSPHSLEGLCKTVTWVSPNHSLTTLISLGTGFSLQYSLYFFFPRTFFFFAFQQVFRWKIITANIRHKLPWLINYYYYLV